MLVFLDRSDPWFGNDECDAPAAWCEVGLIRKPAVAIGNVGFPAENTAYFFYGGLLLISENRGESWRQWLTADHVQEPCPRGFEIESLALSVEGKGVMEGACAHPRGINRIAFETDDMGQSWRYTGQP